MASVDDTPAVGGSVPASALVLALPGSEAAGHYSVSMQDTPLRGFMVLAADSSAGAGAAADASAAPVWHLVLAPALLDASECELDDAGAPEGLTDAQGLTAARAPVARNSSAHGQPHRAAAGWWCPVGAEQRLFPSLAAAHAAVADEISLAIAQRYATHRLQPPASLLRALRTRDLHDAAAGAQAAGEARRRVLRRYLSDATAAAAARARAPKGASSDGVDAAAAAAVRLLEVAEGRSQLSPRAFGAAARRERQAAAATAATAHLSAQLAASAQIDSDSTGGPAARQAWIAPSYSQGARVILGVRLKFYGQTDTVAGLRSEQEIGWLLGNSTADLNRAAFGAAAFSFQMVPGIYTLPSTIAACSSDTTSINTASQSLVAAANPSINIASFQHYANFLPTCGYAWAGLGQIPGTVTWHNGLSGTSPTDTLVVEHEIGHNMVRAAPPPRGASAPDCRRDVRLSTPTLALRWQVAWIAPFPHLCAHTRVAALHRMAVILHPSPLLSSSVSPPRRA
jgi:hypothetical protein